MIMSVLMTLPRGRLFEDRVFNRGYGDYFNLRVARFNSITSAIRGLVITSLFSKRTHLVWGSGAIEYTTPIS